MNTYWLVTMAWRFQWDEKCRAPKIRRRRRRIRLRRHLRPAMWRVRRRRRGSVRRGRRKDLLKRGSLALRGLGTWDCSFLCSLLTNTKNTGSTVYTGVQALRQVHELSTGKQQIFSQRSLAFVDFFGDQIVAYLLVSAAASTVPITNRMREGADNIFTDSSAAAISIELLAFLALAFSALVSGYKLSNQSYV
ncbi:CASP-like protein [Actinidia chinensis var. chinensis]|uniref:CASP-like protein n=1 Tax=Actinidia chinensis var. chinensis TaxID=1590841 RepID=A0A2R6RRS5_ACTCC|nr:CASP-like protein [Actinidia chinensis var. chinensis]